jgi:hypothetical protein
MTRLLPPDERLQRWSAYFLAATMSVAVLVMFVYRLWINPTVFQAMLFTLGVVWAVALTIRPFQLHFSVVLIPLSCTVAWGLVQLGAGWTIGRTDTWEAVLEWFGNLLAFFLAMQVCARSGIRRRFLQTLLYFAFVLSVVAVLQYFSAGGKIYWFYQSYRSAALGPFLNRDQYAAFIEMVLPLALLEALAGGSRSIGSAVIAATLFATVIAGASRAGALLVTAEIVAIPLVLWAKGRRNRGQMRTATVNLWLLALVFAAVVGWTVLWARFDDPDPLKGRREMLRGTVAMVQARPIHGFGLGTFITAFPAYALADFGTVVNAAHNDWVEWAAVGGIPFSLLLLWIAIWSVPKGFKSVWGIGLVAVFVHSIVDFSLQRPVIDLWLFALLGVLAADTRTPSGEPK